jgi:hypothetical protein
MMKSWDELEQFLKPIVFESEIALFRHFYHELQVQNSSVICSLAYLRVRPKSGSQRANAISNVADFLTDTNIRYYVKIFGLRLLRITDNVNHNNNKEQCPTEEQTQQILDFCLKGRYHENNINYEYPNLVYELREACQERFRRASLHDNHDTNNNNKASTNDAVWDSVRKYLVSNNVKIKELPALEAAYRQGVRHGVILASISFLRLCEISHDQRNVRAIRNIANYLADPEPQHSAKIACLQCLLHKNRNDRAYLEKALAFCTGTGPSHDTSAFLLADPEKCPKVSVLWAIRAVILQLNDENEPTTDEPSIIAEAADLLMTSLSFNLFTASESSTSSDVSVKTPLVIKQDGNKRSDALQKPWKKKSSTLLWDRVWNHRNSSVILGRRGGYYTGDDDDETESETNDEDDPLFICEMSSPLLQRI